MIPQEVLNYEYKTLVEWLRYKAGSSNPEYFHAIATNGLKLQQVPEEYASLLLLLKEWGPKTYLELGVGNGGSFAMACFMMQETLSMADAVDCLAYRNLNIGQCEEEINSFVQTVKDNFIDAEFHNKTTDEYFSSCTERFDVIFIDADHSYEGVKKDFANAQKHINQGGLIIFHDIASQACPGIMRIWADIKAYNQESCIEFIHSNTCGIGVLKY